MTHNILTFFWSLSIVDLILLLLFLIILYTKATMDFVLLKCSKLLILCNHGKAVPITLWSLIFSGFGPLPHLGLRSCLWINWITPFSHSHIFFIFFISLIKFFDTIICLLTIYLLPIDCKCLENRGLISALINSLKCLEQCLAQNGT